MADPEIRYRIHALQRMAERHIDPEDIREILRSGEKIEDYSDDQPYPSRLILGFAGARPIHVVAAEAPDEGATIIVTVYEPDKAKWDATFRQRVKP